MASKFPSDIEIGSVEVVSSDVGIIMEQQDQQKDHASKSAKSGDDGISILSPHNINYRCNGKNVAIVCSLILFFLMVYLFM